MKTTTNTAAGGGAVLEELRSKLASRAPADDGWSAAELEGAETAAIAAALDAERVIVAGALLQPLLQRGLLDAAAASGLLGQPAANFAAELGRLGEFRAGAQW
jgi:hypothetical protein